MTLTDKDKARLRELGCGEYVETLVDSHGMRWLERESAERIIARLLRVIEGMECCGNCGHEDEEVLSDTPCGLCRPVREQHSRPSHWIARKGSL